MTSTRFLCLALMIKYTFKTIDEMDWLLVIRVNYKKNSYLNNYSETLLCQANCFNFFSSQDRFLVKHIKFGKRKEHISRKSYLKN